MRREFRERQNRIKKNSNTSVFITGGVLILAIATFIITFIVYSNKLDNDLYSFDSEYLAQYTNTLEVDITNEVTESASSSIGKTVEESENIIKEETNNIKSKNNINKITQTSTATKVDANQLPKRKRTQLFKAQLKEKFKKNMQKIV